jgi:hypothetical protein
VARKPSPAQEMMAERVQTVRPTRILRRWGVLSLFGGMVLATTLWLLAAGTHPVRAQAIGGVPSRDRNSQPVRHCLSHE